MSYKKIKRSEAQEAIRRLASTEDGQIFLAVLADECHFFKSVMKLDDPSVAQYYASVRGIYGRIRNSIPPQHLLEVEYKISIVEDGTIEKKGSKKVKDE